MLGAPGAGKGTQAYRLARALGLQYISSGDLLRSTARTDTPLGRQVRPYIERGDLVPDDIIVALIWDRIESLGDRAGIVLDGFPRTREQAESLDTCLASMGKVITHALYIEVSEPELVRRSAGRLACQVCEATYHAAHRPPQTAGTCDRWGGNLYQRPDDTEGGFRGRLRIYEQWTAPLIDYYRQAGLLLQINGEQPIERVHEDLVAAVRAGV